MDMYYNNSIKTAMGIRHTLHFTFIYSIEYILKQGWQHTWVAKLFGIIRKIFRKQNLKNKEQNWRKITKPYNKSKILLHFYVFFSLNDRQNIYRKDAHWSDESSQKIIMPAR